MRRRSASGKDEKRWRGLVQYPHSTSASASGEAQHRERWKLHERSRCRDAKRPWTARSLLPLSLSAACCTSTATKSPISQGSVTLQANVAIATAGCGLLKRQQAAAVQGRFASQCDISRKFTFSSAPLRFTGIVSTTHHPAKIPPLRPFPHSHSPDDAFSPSLSPFFLAPARRVPHHGVPRSRRNHLRRRSDTQAQARAKDQRPRRPAQSTRCA
jgi:hypothetical protein